jgi:hypothetical protein
MCQDRDDKKIGTERYRRFSPARDRPRLRGHLREPVRQISSSVISRAVDIGPMVDPEDDNPRRFVVYLIDHPVRPAPGGPEPRQFAAQWLTYTAWRGQQVASKKLSDRGGDPFWQPVHGALCRRRN